MKNSKHTEPLLWKNIYVDSQRSGQAPPFCPHAQDKRVGQALLMAVVLIGAAMLSASTIAGLLMVYQIRGSSDIANSQRAIAAADAGLECQMYDEFLQNDSSGNPDPNFVYQYCGGEANSDLIFTNGASTVVTCDDTTKSGQPDTDTNCLVTSTVSNIYSRGSYNGASRVLQASF